MFYPSKYLSAFFLIPTAVCFFASNSSLASPCIQCASPVYNFGSLTNAASVEHIFAIHNGGEDPLKISRIHGCCGTKTSLRDKVIPPSSNTTLKVTLSLKGRRGKTSKSIYVASNDPHKPYLRLRVTGIAYSTRPVASSTITKRKKSASNDVLAVPKTICITYGTNFRKPVVRYIALRSRSKTPFEISAIKLPQSGMTKNIIPIGQAAWRIEIANILPDSSLDGKYITVLTNGKKRQSVTIPIRVINR